MKTNFLTGRYLEQVKIITLFTVQQDTEQFKKNVPLVSDKMTDLCRMNKAKAIHDNVNVRGGSGAEKRRRRSSTIAGSVVARLDTSGKVAAELLSADTPSFRWV